MSEKYYSQSLSFNEAQTIMNNNNSQLKAVIKQEETHQYELKSNKGLRYPKVGLFGAGLYLDKSLGADLNGLRNGIGGIFQLSDPGILGDWDITFLKREILFGGVSVTWPLFTGGKINAAVEASRINVKMGEREVVSTKNKLISELAQRYFQVKLAEEAVEVRRQVLEGMNKHLYDATKLEEQGIIAPVEKLQADVAVSEANRQYLGAQKDADLARTALANTLETSRMNYDLSTDFFLASNIMPLEYYQESALLNYPELQKLKLQSELADQGIKAKQSTYFPTIAAFGQSILVHNNPIGLVERNHKPWVVGVGVSYTLFEGLKNKNEIRAAQATKQTVELYEIKAQNDIQTLVQKIYQQMQKQEEQIQNLNVQITMAQELLRVRSRAFTEGMGTSTDVVDAQMNLSAIRLEKLQAYYNYVVSLATLLEYSGLSYEFIQYANQ